LRKTDGNFAPRSCFNTAEGITNIRACEYAVHARSLAIYTSPTNTPGGPDRFLYTAGPDRLTTEPNILLYKTQNYLYAKSLADLY
jgi:hypothetical protein